MPIENAVTTPPYAEGDILSRQPVNWSQPDQNQNDAAQGTIFKTRYKFREYYRQIKSLKYLTPVVERWFRHPNADVQRERHHSPTSSTNSDEAPKWRKTSSTSDITGTEQEACL